MVQGFDLEKRALLGSAQVLADRTGWDRIRRTGHFSFSTSAFVYLRTAPELLRQLTWFDPEGRPLGTVGEPGQFVGVAPSPDGTRALVTVEEGASRPDTQLWMVDLASGLRSPFTKTSERGFGPVWSTDGRRVAFQLGDRGLVIRLADGGSPDVSAGEAGESWSPSGWSLDGSALIVSVYRGVKGYDLATLSADGKEEPKLVLDAPAQEFGGMLSPDGKWLGYLSDESGQGEIYLTGYPDLGRRWPLTGVGLREFQLTGPSELLYTDPAGLVYALSFREGVTGLELMPRQPSFGGQALPGPSAYVPLRDRFLVAVPVPGQETEDSLVLVTNWQSGLR